ncbi:MAG: T9SS type A sorting domain-containing protein [Lewinellaceae bacterium]|nr:T9SS type A sorting domain-containing protein [Lewinellaceae bacterium]
MIADVDIRTGVYSIGYPMSNTPLNYTDVPGPAYFINGPGPDDEVNFHETGHALAISKFAGEEEALVNFPYIMAMNYGLNVDLNEAVNYSFVPNTFDIDKTATHRMVSNTFGSERNISNTVNDEVRYQHRGYGHYFEIVNMLGWCPLRNFWKQESIDFENGIDHGINDQNIDSRIIRMSVAAQADLRPLFHVFGILPQDSIALQDTLAQIGVLPSLTIYNRLQDYLDLIPEDNTAFVNYALSVYPNLYTDGPTEAPEYGVGWHYLKSLTYDAAEAQNRTAILQSIIDLYFPNGAPAGNGNPDVCCLLDTLNVDMVNEEVLVTGGVKPYEISIDTTGNVKTVTVVDFDGCESTAQYTLSGLVEADMKGIKIYPNPASTEIYIDLTGSSTPIEGLQIVSINGQVLKHFRNSDSRIDISTLNEGVYILQIEMADGVQINKRVLILR